MAYYMKQMRQSILDGKFPEFVEKHLTLNFPDKRIPAWVYDSLKANQVDVEGMNMIRSEDVAAAADVHLVPVPKHTEMVDPVAAEALKNLANAALPVEEALKALEESKKEEKKQSEE